MPHPKTTLGDKLSAAEKLTKAGRSKSKKQRKMTFPAALRKIREAEAQRHSNLLKKKASKKKKGSIKITRSRGRKK